MWTLNTNALTHASTTIRESCTQFLLRMDCTIQPILSDICIYLANIENARFTIFRLVLRVAHSCFTLSRAAPRERKKYAFTLREGVPWVDPVMHFYLDRGLQMLLLSDDSQIHFRDVSIRNVSIFLECN